MLNVQMLLIRPLYLHLKILIDIVSAKRTTERRTVFVNGEEIKQYATPYNNLAHFSLLLIIGAAM